MIRAMSEHEERRRRGDQGFTLIELLVVIIILGILAAVVVFAVSGVGDKGASAARAIEARTLRTAQEAFFARNSHYASADELVSGGFLADLPGYYQTEAVPVGTPDSSGGGPGSNDPSKGSFIVYCGEIQPGCVGGGGALKLGWSVQNPPPGFTHNLQDVFFVNHLTGYAVATVTTGAGAMIKTTDGGLNWSSATVPPTPQAWQLLRVHCVEASRCWAVGIIGTILRTIDGISWSIPPNPLPSGYSSADYKGVYFLDQNNGWAVGSGGRILRTQDGGVNWSGVMPSSPGRDFRQVRFVDPMNGWAVGVDTSISSAVIYRTTNGGASAADWTPTVLGELVTLTDIDCIGTQQCWVVGVGGRNWRTINGGSSWTQQPNMCGNRSSVSFTGSQRGWSAGSTGCALNVTSDGGNSWTVDNAATTPGSLNGVHMLDSAHGWAVGTSGRVRMFGPVP